MILGILHGLWPRWLGWPTSFLSLGRLWRRMFPAPTLSDVERQALCFPPQPTADGTKQPPRKYEQWVPPKVERDAQLDAYIKAIRIEDVLKLASSHNMQRECREFRPHAHGSFNVCFFVEFPSDGQKWVVRFPICSAIYNPWQKLQSEIATMEYIRKNTTIRIPQVFGYGNKDENDQSSSTNLPYVILEYISGNTLDVKQLLDAPDETSRRFLSDLADTLAQLRAQEFDCGGALVHDDTGGFTITSPHTLESNTLQLQGLRGEIHPQATAFDFALCHYEILAQRLTLPSQGMQEDDARHELFALEDFKVRLFQAMDASLNFEPFVLSHGDLRPPNIIVNEDFTIKAIIDWEWSGTVPRQFFMPPLWLAGSETGRGVRNYNSDYSRLYEELLAAGKSSDACSALAAEWGPALCSDYRLFLPAALLRQHTFMHIYYLSIFPEFYKDVKRVDKVREFYESSRVFRQEAREKWEASEKYTDYLKVNGLLNQKQINEQLRIEALLKEAARVFAKDPAPRQAT